MGGGAKRRGQSCGGSFAPHGVTYRVAVVLCDSPRDQVCAAGLRPSNSSPLDAYHDPVRKSCSFYSILT